MITSHPGSEYTAEPVERSCSAGEDCHYGEYHHFETFRQVQLLIRVRVVACSSSRTVRLRSACLTRAVAGYPKPKRDRATEKPDPEGSAKGRHTGRR